MSKDYKVKKFRKEKLRFLDCYSVESEYDNNLVYLADTENFALLRHNELKVLEIREEAPDFFNRLIEPFRSEAKEIWQDVMDVMGHGCCQWDLAKLDKQIERDLRGTRND